MTQSRVSVLGSCGTSVAQPGRVPSGELTPETAAIDADTGPVTAVDVGLAIVTPFRLKRRKGDSLAHAPTPLVEISAGLERERVSLTPRILGGRYRLGRQLGAGGYGAVYAAEDTISGERVAIKVLSPAASQSHELVIRFHREAIAASRVRHPHIVNVADFDIDDDDGHFIVMEHLDGRDLAQTLIEARPLAPLRALTIAAQCARGLAAAHRVGVLHRDLKPANVFLVRKDDGGETVKVIDFGISKLTQIAGDYTDLTSSSKVVGTPSYMSPEQARGAELDARTDVYALGVMLFEMLIGERPFSGRSPIEIIGNHMSAPRLAPSTLRAELTAFPGLDDLVLRAIAPAREQRFASMAAFADALIACIAAGAPEAAAHVTEPTGGQRSQRDREVTSPVTRVGVPRWLFAAAAVAATLAVVGIASRISQDSPAPRHVTPAASNAPVVEPRVVAAPVLDPAVVAAPVVAPPPHTTTPPASPTGSKPAPKAALKAAVKPAPRPASKPASKPAPRSGPAVRGVADW